MNVIEIRPIVRLEKSHLRPVCLEISLLESRFYRDRLMALKQKPSTG